jgi:hypothetical protein
MREKKVKQFLFGDGYQWGGGGTEWVKEDKYG